MKPPTFGPSTAGSSTIRRTSSWVATPPTMPATMITANTGQQASRSRRRIRAEGRQLTQRPSSVENPVPTA